MSKATLKLNRNVQKALMLAKPELLKFDGFERFSYNTEWDNFPGSLKIHCYFNSDASLQQLLHSHQDEVLSKQIQLCFLKVGIKFKDIRKNIIFTRTDKQLSEVNESPLM